MLKHLFFSNIRFQRCYLLLMVLGLSFGAIAQKEVEKAKTYLNANAAHYHLSNNDISEIGISSEYLSPSTGWYHIYFVQKHQSIEVYNGILNVTLANDNVMNVGNTFVRDIALKVPAFTLIPLTPLDAVSKAATSLNLPGNAANTQEVSINRLPNGQIEKAVYKNSDLSNENIYVKLYWLPKDSISAKSKAAQVNLVWNVQISTKDFKNKWSVQVDAMTGDILDTKDMVIHCNFGIPEHTHDHDHGIMHEPINKARENISFLQPLAANSYNVFDYPLESPNHGARTIVTNPYTKFVPAGTGPGATNGWHNDGTTNFTNTQGNNVWAKDDIANDNEGTIGSNPVSPTLDFNYSYTQSTGTAAANRNAAITNLFYWNNLIHDVLWKYGFDEPSGNYQETNMSRGGLGSDYVYADAQDGSGTSNANFRPEVDGVNGRMQMYLWSNGGNPQYQPDSDFDNGVITHEYGHGWSTRLTGGPANSSCLQNVEQGGEGWSDYLALMLTTNWASLSPNLASANLAKGIGTYSLAQTTTDIGIRTFKYSYDMANVNPGITYGKVATMAQPHGIGSIWAAMLWDMTWEIIMQDAQIVNNIYTTPAVVTNMRGNIAALKLVNEGLRLQPCSPSFVDARDAILKADSALFNKRYRCSIWKAFARRGLGLYASTGASSNDRYVYEDFTPYTDRQLSSPRLYSACSRSPFIYTATTAAAGTTTFNWTRAAVAGISNPASSGNTANINETLINTTSNPIIVTYLFNLTPNVCGTVVLQPVRVIINPSPVPLVGTYNICKNGNVPNGEGLSVTNIPNSSSLSGTLTTSHPYYMRGSGDNTTTYTPSNLYVYYGAHTFVADVSGTFDIHTGPATNLSPDKYDTYLTLYQGTFNPNSPSTNFLKGDDDGYNSTLAWGSKLTYNFTAGTTYVLVVSTYTSGATGSYTVETSTNLFRNIGWYTAPSSPTAIWTGSVFNPVGTFGSGLPNTATAGTYNYFLSTSQQSVCRAQTSFIVNETSIGGSVAGSTTACSNTNSGTLTLSGHTGAILRWESSTDNFASNIVNINNTTTTLPYSNLTQTTKFRAVVKNGVCAQVYSGIATITRANATPPSPTGNSRCGTGTVTLTATGCAGGTINWYASATGTAILATGTTYTTPSISSSTTYYVSCIISGCTSTRATVTATVNPTPGLPTPTGASRCGPGTVTLTASGCAGGSVNWYTVSTGGTSVGTGGTYTTPSISTTTTYYVSCTVNGCTSASRAPVQAVINANLTMSGNQPAGNYRASQSITSTANVASGVNYYAGKHILLNPGFQAGGSKVFQAKIENCP
ncbi:M36 family metallopeptidase [Emticicia sp. C21]|uniref:M36 family metallopeptidase n=1 Tax=Emticicia sp. C21 TaxID=2302915 RepID=UPI000E35063E|nr:M36 family metallopeptidase [Emticicia sp. C21]RFS17822.1 hypothetical protein D0T08_00815 [Emticicia sp. C21]